MSPCELSLTAELYGSLPTIQQKLIKEITSPQSPINFAKTTYCYIERLNFIWNEVSFDMICYLLLIDIISIGRHC